jgi:hypothetical protein
MAWSAGSITSATPWSALSQKVKDLITAGPNLGNWSFVKNIPAGTGTGQTGDATYSIDLFRCRGAATLYERVVQKNLASSQITTDGTVFAHTVTTPAASRFITVLVWNTKASAADDPTSVVLNGSNAPTFTKIKSQISGGASTILKGTLWIGKSSGSAPTGTTLTVTFGATQTGCIVIMDEWSGVDLALAATSVDPTGAAQIGIQVVGGSGTNQLAHSATLAAFLGQQSCAVTWAAETASIGTYTAGIEAGWAALGADITMATPTVHARGMWRNDPDDITGTLTNSVATAMTDWACIAFEFQRKVNTASITDANDAGKDWYFMIEIPVADGVVTSSFNAAEDYDGFEMFRRMPPTPTTAVPVSPGGWRSNSLTSYDGQTGNNRTNMAHQILNTSGFNYWIKMTKNLIVISTRVGAAEAMNGAMLLDSFVTIATDLPLISVSDHTATGNSMSRLPGVTTSVATNAFQCSTQGWTTPITDGVTTQAVNAQDFWSGGKVHAGRLFTSHSAGRVAAAATTSGYARGLWKDDFRCIRTGGTVNLGDTMVIAGNTWTVIGTGTIGGSGSDASLVVLVRAN